LVILVLVIEKDLACMTDVLLKDLLLHADTTDVRMLMQRAFRYEYHDYKSEEVMPTLHLIQDLQAAGLHDMVERAKSGYYDEHPDDDDLLELCRDLGLSQTGLAYLRGLQQPRESDQKEPYSAVDKEEEKNVYRNSYNNKKKKSSRRSERPTSA
jgi:hypothetical protein